MTYPALDTWQYRLASDLSDGIDVNNGWRLETGSDLPVIVVVDANGAPAGWLLGFPIDLAARRKIAETWRAPTAMGPDADAFAHDLLWSLGGRFLWIFANDTIQRVYTDCCGQVSCVYDPVRKIVGSTADAIFDDVEYNARLDRTRYDTLGVDGEGWYPAELTAHEGLHRLMANHYIDLKKWVVERHWPKGDIPISNDLDGLVVNGRVKVSQRAAQNVATLGL